MAEKFPGHFSFGHDMNIMFFHGSRVCAVLCAVCVCASVCVCVFIDEVFIFVSHFVCFFMVFSISRRCSFETLPNEPAGREWPLPGDHGGTTGRFGVDGFGEKLDLGKDSKNLAKRCENWVVFYFCLIFCDM